MYETHFVRPRDLYILWVKMRALGIPKCIVIILLTTNEFFKNFYKGKLDFLLFYSIEENFKFNKTQTKWTIAWRVEWALAVQAMHYLW